MDNEFEADLLTLIDEDGKEQQFEILDIIEQDEKSYFALYPVFNSPEEELESDGVYYIFETVEENGEELLVEVEDEELSQNLAEIFEDHFENMYADEDVESDEV